MDAILVKSFLAMASFSTLAMYAITKSEMHDVYKKPRSSDKPSFLSSFFASLHPTSNHVDPPAPTFNNRAATINRMPLDKTAHLQNRERHTKASKDAVKTRTNTLETQTDAAETETDAIKTHKDAIETQTDAIKTHKDAIETQTDAVETQTDAIETRTNTLETQTDAVETRTDAIETQTDAVETQTEPQTDVMETQTDVLETQTDVLETQTDVMETQTDVMETQTDVMETQTDATETQTDAVETQKTDVAEAKEYRDVAMQTAPFLPPVAVREDGAVLKQELHTILSKIDDLIKSNPQFIDPYSLQEAQRLRDTTSPSNESIEQARMLLGNLYEDIRGAVRVFVRVRDQVATKTGGGKKQAKLLSAAATENDNASAYIDASKTICEVPLEGPQKPFMAVFTPTDTNESIFRSQIHPLITQMAHGYNVAMFGYGFSGSGKTFTLLGSDKVDGLLQLAIRALVDMNCKVKAINAYELYIDDGDPVEYKFIGSTDKFKVGACRGRSLAWTREFKSVGENGEGIGLVIEKLVKKRIAAGTIKWTPNNPVSSRSHFVVDVEVQMPNGSTQQVSIMDMAGLEQPEPIYQKLSNAQTAVSLELGNALRYRAMNLTNAQSSPIRVALDIEGIQTKVQSKSKYGTLATKHDRLRYLYDLMDESAYINRTLSELKTYFLAKQQGLDTANMFSGSETRMIDALKTLDRPKTKFVMICTVRQEAGKCTDTKNAIDFAKSISSVSYQSGSV